MKAIALLLPLLLLATASAPAPETIRDQVIAGARSQLPLAFERTTHVVQVGGGTRTVTHRIERWDGAAWSIVSINGKPPTASDIREQAKAVAAQPIPGYHRLAGLLAAATTRDTDAQGRSVLIIPQLPPGTVVNAGTDISAHLRAEAIVVTNAGQPWVQRLTLTNREPFKMSWALKVLAFEQVSEYQLDASGRPRLASQANDSTGTMFGFNGGQKAEITYVYR